MAGPRKQLAAGLSLRANRPRIPTGHLRGLSQHLFSLVRVTARAAQQGDTEGKDDHARQKEVQHIFLREKDGLPAQAPSAVHTLCALLTLCRPANLLPAISGLLTAGGEGANPWECPGANGSPCPCPSTCEGQGAIA